MACGFAFRLLCVISIYGSLNANRPTKLIRPQMEYYRRNNENEECISKENCAVTTNSTSALATTSSTTNTSTTDIGQPNRLHLLCSTGLIKIESCPEIVEYNAKRTCGLLDTWYSQDPKSCKDYYSCLFGETEHMTCPKDHQFSTRERRCLKMENDSECIISGPSKPSTFQPSLSKSKTTSTTADPDPPVTEEEESIVPDLYCNENDKRWVKRDPLDCTYYYICVMGRKSHMKCPGNLEFSEMRSKCLSRDKANCQVLRRKSKSIRRF